MSRFALSLVLGSCALLGCGTSRILPPIDGTDRDAGGDQTTGVSCGVGTVLIGDECVATPVQTGPTCGPGTMQSGDECVPTSVAVPPTLDAGPMDAAPSLTCGPGTYESDGGVCLSLSGAGGCPPGTVNLGGACVGDDAGLPAFVVRAPASVPSDGYSVVPVLALGPVGADGSGPAVVLSVSPALGSVTTATLALDSVGATTYYRACDSATSAACTGSVQITLALASAPATVLAVSDPIALVPPTGVGSTAACLTGGNVLFLDGDPGAFIHPGIETLTNGTWGATSTSEYVQIDMTPAASNESLWTLTFSSQQLGQALAAQVYTGAARYPFEPPGAPGLDISGNGGGCNTLSGSFQIEEVDEADGGTLEGFTATFEQHCEEQDAGLRGCVHYGN